MYRKLKMLPVPLKLFRIFKKKCAVNEKSAWKKN